MSGAGPGSGREVIEPIDLRTNLRARVLAAVRAHGVARVAEAGAGVLLLPYVLAHLSREEYGLWGWLLAVAGHLALVDLGLSHGNVRPIAGRLVRGDLRGVGEVLTAAVSLHVALALAIVLGTLAARAPVTAAFEGHPELLEALVLVLVAQSIRVCGYPFGSLLAALQRADLLHRIRSGHTILYVLGTVVVLGAGGRVRSLAGLQVALATFETTVRVLLAMRHCPGLRPVRPEPERWPELARVGAPLLVLSAAGALAATFERFFLGFVVDLTLLAQYAVAARLVWLVRELPLVLVSSVAPASASLDVAGDEAAVRRLYLRSLKVAAITALPLAAMLAVAGAPLVTAWVGESFETAGRLATPIGLGLLVPMLAAPGAQVLIGRGRIAAVWPVYAFWAVAAVVGNVVWLRAFGFPGAGWGMALVNALGTAVLLDRLHRCELGVASEAWRTVALAAAGTILAGGLAFFAAAGLAELWPGEGRFTLLVRAVLASAVLAGTFAAWALGSGLLDAEDRRLVLETLGLGGRDGDRTDS